MRLCKQYIQRVGASRIAFTRARFACSRKAATVKELHVKFGKKNTQIMIIDLLQVILLCQKVWRAQDFVICKLLCSVSSAHHVSLGALELPTSWVNPNASETKAKQKGQPLPKEVSLSCIITIIARPTQCTLDISVLCLATSLEIWRNWIKNQQVSGSRTSQGSVILLHGKNNSQTHILLYFHAMRDGAEDP